MTERFDATPVLSQLKDFQRASVDHAFDALHRDGGSRRFLVADEVGLGKTMVARGVIAKTVEALWDDVERIDIVYICSNSAIAQQNIRRLNVMPDQGFSFSSRMTMIAREVGRLAANKVNFISFTPGTSFELKSTTGRSDERVLLYWLTRHVWGSGVADAPGAVDVWRCGVTEDNWPRAVESGRVDVATIDPGLLAEFAEDLVEIDARSRFVELAARFAARDVDDDPEGRSQRDLLIGELRQRLARRSVHALEPDLVVLDEFQRFRNLMNGQDDAAELARDLFAYEGNRTLLLSATPYKMFTNRADEEDDHHRDFLDTVRFLLDGDSARFESAMEAFRAGVLDIGRLDPDELRRRRHAVEGELGRVMVRTERLGAGSDRNGMLTEHVDDAPLAATDVTSYVVLERLGEMGQARGLVEYWKSVPAFVNFADGYKAGAAIERALLAPDTASAARTALRGIDNSIDWDAWRRFDDVDAGNPRLRSLQEQTVDNEAWRILWIAPSLPYYELGAAWSGPRRDFTKRLVFSAWTGTPKSVSSLLSYEVDRRVFGMRPTPVENSADGMKNVRGPLLFRRDPMGRPGAMNTFAFVYPSPTLATLGDPLAIARERRGPVPVDEVRSDIGTRIEAALADLDVAVDHSHVGTDQRWYWAAPLLLDAAAGASPFMGHKTRYLRSWLGPNAEASKNENFADHIDLAAEMYRGEVPLGPRPDDLVDVLVDAALGSPATVAWRSLGTVFGDSLHPERRRDVACQMGWAFRALFNLPDVNSLVRAADWGQDYWRTATRYCVDGCLSAVIDEYLHVLRESLGLFDLTPDSGEATTNEIAVAFAEAVGVRSTNLEAHDLLDPEHSRHRVRTRYAMRFGNDRSETEESAITASHLRRAFNSPFWPFVLTTTSIGQEGLDFHLYCHAIVHWNLPSNPVDLEQREGRVHRYKGHAIRRNLADDLADAAWTGEGDPWEAIFAAAARRRGDGDSELVPYWVYPGRAKIERHVPLLPLSREVSALARLKRDVARYRLVFGQPRQDDLLDYLGSVPDEKLDELRIDLSPRASGDRSS